MKSLVQYILESYESPSIYLVQRILSLVASMGDTNKNFGTHYAKGDMSQAGCYPSLFNFDNDITYEDIIASDFDKIDGSSQVEWYHGQPNWKNKKAKKIYDYLTINDKDLEYLDSDGTDSKSATGQTRTMYKRNGKMVGERGEATRLLRCVRYAFKQMRDGYVIYWDLAMGDPGGACYTTDDIRTASVFAFEYYTDDEWLNRGTEFEPIFYKSLDDAASDRLPILVCRFFKNVEAAEFWRKKIRSLEYKDGHDVFIIDFSNPSPEAIKFLQKHKTIRQHKSPGIYGHQYGKRLGVALNEATAMDRLMYLIREFRGEKQKAPYKRDHDFERETVWKDGDSKDKLTGGEEIVRKNPNRPKNRDRKCNCSSFTITRPAHVPFEGHDIEVYREICNDCGKETYGFSIDRGRSESWTEGGYKTTDERNKRINAILKDLGVKRKYGL